ncbi:MAG: ABC-type transporter, periplasmic subunit [Firmicutes bacterium]|nr:ABC-type transporter, periplasmic subunit [Bacillota bacterium]
MDRMYEDIVQMDHEGGDVMSKRWIVLGLLLVMVGMMLTGCGGAGKEQVARLSVGGEPESMDPAKTNGIPESCYQTAMFEGLTEYDNDGLPKAAAAENWEVSPDGMVYTFHLRANKWANGDPVTAQDFEYAWKRLLDPKTAAEYSYMLFPIKNAEAFNSGKASADDVGVKALDDKTLQVTLEKPTGYFLSLCAHTSTFPVNPKVVEAAGDNWAGDVKTLVGNGPFKPTEWQHGSKLVMVKNDQYWDKDKVKVSKIEWTLVEEVATALSMFENNQLDYVDGPPLMEAERLLKEKKLSIGNNLGTYYYSFNTTKAPFDNPKVRRAFALAIDREAIAATVMHGLNKPAYGWIPYGFTNPVTKKDFREEGGDLFKANVEEAKKLLAEAGYPEGKGLPPVTLLFNTNEMHKAIAEAVQEMWKKNLGVTVELQNQEWKVFLGVKKAGDYQIARDGWSGDYTDPMTFADMLMANSGNNYGRYNNPVYDQLVRVAQTSNDQSVRMQAMHDAEKIAMDDMAILPIYAYVHRFSLSPKLQGLIIPPTTIINVKYLSVQE